MMETATPLRNFPPTRRCPLAEPEEYTQARAEGPLVRVTTIAGEPVWWTTTYEAARAVLADTRFSSNRKRDGFPLFTADPCVRQNIRKLPDIVMIGMDGPEHSRTRRSAIGEFTVKRLAGLRPRIQQIVDELIDDLLASQTKPVDLVQALSLPVPSQVICELLGVPYADFDFFQERTSRLLRRTATPEERRSAAMDMREYLAELVGAKLAEPAEDVISRLIERQREAGPIDRDELVSMSFLLVTAGHEATANMISMGTIGFLENPAQLAAITADPATIPQAVDEMLRYFSVADTVPRVAAEDVEICGVTIKAGEGVVASTISANHDSEIFADPAELDIERGAQGHIAFGYGPHLCIGQNLAREELEVVYETLFRRIPTLRLAVPVDDIPFKDDGVIYGACQLPVTW